MSHQLIIEAGGSNTQIALITEVQEKSTWTKRGFHPLHNKVQDLEEIIIALIAEIDSEIQIVNYYGAGVISTSIQRTIAEQWQKHLQNAQVNVHDDIMASARASFGMRAGFGGILGTGSVCYECINGKVRRQSHSLGYLLGDEGSGYYLGKLFLRAYLSDQLEREISECFESTYKMTKNDVLQVLYADTTNPKSFLAQFTYFIKDQANASMALQKIVDQNFKDWVILQILPFGSNFQSIGLTGSIATIFKSSIFEILNEFGISVEQIIKEPMEALIHFHQNHRS